MEPVVGPDLLHLTVGVLRRLPVPQPDVVDGGLIGFQRLCRQALFYREGFHRDAMKIVGLLRRGDVALDVRRFELQLVRLHIYALHQSRHDFRQHEGGPE